MPVIAWLRAGLLVLVAWAGMFAAGTVPALAACGGGGLDPTSLARMVGRQADTIILGRLIDIDAEHAHHFELLAVYRGEAPSSPIGRQPGSAAGIIDVGGCTNQHVGPGQRFIYAEGDRRRYGPLQVVFPEVREGRWVVDHFGERRSLDELLALLGVLPATSTIAPPVEVADESPFGTWVALVLIAGLTAALYLVLARRSNVVASRPGP
jgi:hypothetical protein